MISREEIVRVAGDLGLRPDVVEKDYVLGWMLAGIFQDEVLAPAWVFKGGTCLKKCFFETYRFSEDLDFTITDRAHLDSNFLIDRFKRIGQWVYDTTGIEIPPDLLRFDVWDTDRGSRAGNGRISYRGPMARGGDPPRIRLDLTADEVLVREPVMRGVGHPYTDAPADGIEARCYAFDEVFGEKIRALAERSRPRDLYDVINLFRNGELAAAADAVREVVQRKCAFKGIAFPTLAALNPFRDELVGEWQNMLGHQLPALPPIQSFLDALPEFFDWLMGQPKPIIATVHPFARNTEIIRARAGAIGFGEANAPAIETIRFAAANRLCIDLEYRDEQGRQSTRVIEPYSLRRTQAGDVLLMAVRSDSGEARSYRLDRILSARATQRAFSPRYPVELTPSGPLSIPDKETRVSSAPGLSGAFNAPRARPHAPQMGPTYVFRCTVCGKEFERKTYDGTLRAHKNRAGQDCYGRFGTYVRTKY
jgi:predicted nucleotidyltransferase component of viral defense system